jgi:hypothetical protein
MHIFIAVHLGVEVKIFNVDAHELDIGVETRLLNKILAVVRSG